MKGASFVPLYKKVEWNKRYKKRGNEPCLVAQTPDLEKIPFQFCKKVAMHMGSVDLSSQEDKYTKYQPRDKQLPEFFLETL